jgi:hypothetical protein
VGYRILPTGSQPSSMKTKDCEQRSFRFAARFNPTPLRASPCNQKNFCGNR